MLLSDVSIKRPVFASVIAIITVIFGIVSFLRLPLREFPDIDPPIVTIRTEYLGASAQVMETRITQVLEDRVSGIEGLKTITSASEDGNSKITLEFNIERDIDSAVNDVRDRVSAALGALPAEAEPPAVEKVDSSDDVIMWLNLGSDQMSILELTDYAKRYLEQKFSILPGVARIRVGGGLEYSMRIWVDRKKLAARSLTINDIEDALRRQNVELPAGSVDSEDLTLSARVERSFATEDDFRQLILARDKDGYLIRLADVAEIRKEAVENRVLFRGNKIPMVGIGIVKQSQANTVQVATDAKELATKLNQTLPKGMKIEQSYDSSVFIKASIREVYITLGIAIFLVILVIYLFLRDFRVMFIPSITIPITLIGVFTLFYVLGMSINLITMLALVLMIGLLVDDAIIVLENIMRRIHAGETPIVASFNGARQVAFAVIATSMVLVSVFIPISFLEGILGRLFTEFSLTTISTILISTFIALSLTPMLCSKILKKDETVQISDEESIPDAFYVRSYGTWLQRYLNYPRTAALSFFAVILLSIFMFALIPREYAPKEDRGVFYVLVDGPEGASFAYMQDYMNRIEDDLMSYVESGEISRLLVRAPRGFGALTNFNSGVLIIVLTDWSERRNGFVIMNEVRKQLSELPGIRAFPLMRQSFSVGTRNPVQFVIGGPSYEVLASWRDKILARIEKDNPGLQNIDFDYKETKPQLRIGVNLDLAADLGVSNLNIGRTLETMLGSRKVTTFIDDGEEYDVIIEGEQTNLRSLEDIENIYVRSSTSGDLIPLANLITINETADSRTLNRYNRLRAIKIDAGLDSNLSLGQALDYMEKIAKEELPEDAVIDYQGESLAFKESQTSIFYIFFLSLILVYLVLSAQFESFIQPFVIILVVPTSLLGALLGLYIFGQSLNVYTEVALILLIGLASKNGILIVEFINQLRDKGVEFNQAILQASLIRLRPILMTGLTTIIGTIPLILATGAGSETRFSIGIVVFWGVLFAMFFTLFFVPIGYKILAKHTDTPGKRSRELQSQLK